jgi:hypothetical protein
VSTAIDAVLSRLTISQVARTLGVKLDRTGRRGVAHWRRGMNFSVALNDQKGAWHDHVTGEGGGMVDLVVAVHGGTRREALEWLAALAGVELSPQTREQARNWAREAQETTRALEWKRELLDRLRQERNGFLRAYHRAKDFVLSHDPEVCERNGDARFEAALSLGESYMERVEELDKQIDAVQDAGNGELLKVWRTRVRGVAA